MNYNSSLVDQFTQVILLATLTTLVPYAFSAAAQLMLLFQDRALFSRGTWLATRRSPRWPSRYSFWMI